jgi:hypothetical protein
MGLLPAVLSPRISSMLDISRVPQTFIAILLPPLVVLA